jgi:hypothetical protein
MHTEAIPTLSQQHPPQEFEEGLFKDLTPSFQRPKTSENSFKEPASTVPPEIKSSFKQPPSS